MFWFFEFIFPWMFLLIFGIVIATFVKGLIQWGKNNSSPRLTVPAKLISRRYSVSHHNHNGNMHRSTSHYVTFEFESGDRMEFHVAGHQYGLMVEGDRGNLTFQGTRFLDFQRT